MGNETLYLLMTTSELHTSAVLDYLNGYTTNYPMTFRLANQLKTIDPFCEFFELSKNVADTHYSYLDVNDNGVVVCMVRQQIFVQRPNG